MVMSSGDAESSLVNETSAVSTTVQINVVNETAVSRHNTAISDRQRPPFSDLSRRWGSTDLCHSAGAGSDLRSRLAESRGASGVLESRRWTSECSLCAVGLAVHENGNAGKRQVGSIGGGAVDSKVDDVSSVTSSVASDSRNGTCKRCVQLEPISVPYLSPLVLRKEMENVLDQEGDLCLSSAEFIDQHPIIYWNLVWYFRRLNVPSHMPGFVLTAKCVNKNLPPSNVWTSNDSRYVGLHSNWDNIHMHTDHGPPMYVLWNKGNQSSPDAPVVSKSVMHSIVSSIKSNDVVSPLRLLLNERVKQRDCGRNRFHSIYRDILFLSFAALGRDCIDNDAYDREFRTMFDELPSRDKARMRVADRAPNQLTVSCRRLFANLEF